MSEKDSIQLLDKYLNGNCTEEEQLRVQVWLEQMNNQNSEWLGLSNEDKKSMIRDMFQDLQENINDGTSNNLLPKKRKWLYWSAAAVLLLATTLSVLFFAVPNFLKPETVQQYTNTSTGIGETKKIMLEDGTQVWLNAMSALKHPDHFGIESREVFLQGEAFFKVSKDAEKPFIIHTESLSTQVLGTVFNIKAYKEDKTIEVTVISGRVAVENKQRENTVVLTQNERARYNKKLDKLSETKVTDAKNAMAWQQGQLVFHHTPLNEMAQRFYRAFGLKIVFENKQISKCRISGRFNIKQKPEEILKAICLTIGGQFTKQGKIISITGNGCQ